MHGKQRDGMEDEKPGRRAALLTSGAVSEKWDSQNGVSMDKHNRKSDNDFITVVKRSSKKNHESIWR